MNKKDRVKMVLASIDETKEQVADALDTGDIIASRELMGNLYGLEACLVNESAQLIEELETSKYSVHSILDSMADAIIEQDCSYYYVVRDNKLWECRPMFVAPTINN